jgi:RNA polymerase sporulation-specific sigma factor
MEQRAVLTSVRLEREDHSLALVRRAQMGDQTARDAVVTANLALVRSLVGRFAGTGYDLDDLFQIGCLGLLKAVDRFDFSYDVRFSTYAVPMILGEIRRHLRDDGLVRVSRSTKALAYSARKAREALTGTLGREPTVAEISEAIGAPREEVVAALEASRPVNSIHETIHEGDGDPIFVLDRIAALDPGEEEWAERAVLRQGLASLPDRERRILALRFFRGKTQSEVAEMVGVSQVQVSRIERRALEMLRVYIGE